MDDLKQNELSKTYDPSSTEKKWYDFWLEKGFFHADVDDPGRPFSIVIPPPNVTGELHMGHALNNTLQDILIRWKRMQGYNTVWIPGTDHAGIATQIKVEAQLAKEGLSKYDLGREKFLERVWDWKAKYGGRIVEQLKRLGTSCDWERERFTLDEGCSRAVREVFVDLFDKGLIYKGNYIINWCPECRTALSDIEVEHAETAGKIYRIRYPYADGSGYIVVATTRPETMLGDTAVAVNPGDERYTQLVGKKVILPLLNRELPIIQDEYVDPAFGTGMVKVTPAHDPNDFEIGLRHNLERLKVIDEDGKMTELAGPYAGLDRYECRKAVLRDLEAAGLLDGVEDHTHAVGHCYRCDTVIEPLISEQWFVRTKELAGPAIKAVEEGRIKFTPERFTKMYLNWMYNVRDWCISRQLWWGHRIPVWYCDNCGAVIASKTDLEECTKCGSHKLRQDPDVLDTWFSSALWPFSTLGWPDDTKELRKYYPTSVLVTAYDIIFFWVARMVLMGMEFMNEVPFREVLINGLVRDSEGRKMSKSLGNGVDPLEVVDEYGADALRFTLVIGTASGNDMRFHQQKVEASRNFANKIWNASRFALMNLSDFDPDDDAPVLQAGGRDAGTDEAGELADRWIMSRCNRTVSEVTRHLNRFDPGEAAGVLYDFTWSELCDWYIELIKPRLYGKCGEASRKAAQRTLWRVLDTTLRLLHPFMPFLTEEIWQRLPHRGPSIMVAEWPVQDDGLYDEEAESRMEIIMDVIRSIRNIRSEKKVQPGRKIEAILHTGDGKSDTINTGSRFIIDLAGLSQLIVRESGAEKPLRSVSTVAAGGVEIFLPLAGMLDIEEESRRLRKELEQVEEEYKKTESKLSNPKFLEKAPQDVVQRERRKEQELSEAREKLLGLLRELED